MTKAKGIRAMAFGIIIYEEDDYLYSLIRERLSFRFPQAYIDKADKRGLSSDFKLIKDILVLYDNKTGNMPPSNIDGTAIPLFYEDGKGHLIIDIRRICDSILRSGAAQSNGAVPVIDDNDRLRLLISYAYIDERENFIKRVIGPDSFDTMHPIRIDLMSGIRMPPLFTHSRNGSITTLLRKCTDRKFDPKEILSYLNPDSNGFLSAGKPESEDDVYDSGIASCSRLMALLKALCIRDNAGALVVAEGWRESELLELIQYCDTLHILLPARMCTEDTGMVKELGLFKRALTSGALMTVHYCEDYKENYESIRI